MLCRNKAATRLKAAGADDVFFIDTPEASGIGMRFGGTCMTSMTDDFGLETAVKFLEECLRNPPRAPVS